MIDEITAREIAGYWHSGQGDPLYAFASSGYVEPETEDDSSLTLWAAERALTSASPEWHTDNDIQQLESLVEYLREAVKENNDS